MTKTFYESNEFESFNKPIYKGFNLSELNTAWNSVISQSFKDGTQDWRDPIDSYCTTEEAKAVKAAIEFYTATVPIFDYIGECQGQSPNGPLARFKNGDLILKVRADGYRKGPAGDH